MVPVRGIAQAKPGGQSGHRAYRASGFCTSSLPTVADFERQQMRDASGTQEGVPGGEGSCIIWVGALNCWGYLREQG